MDIRRNHRDMTAQQKQDFIQAIFTLKNDTPSLLRPGQQNRYDDFAQIHKNAMGGSNALVPPPHRSPLFYPWHRIFLREFEIALQTSSGNWDITIPYWDWNVAGPEVDSTPFTPAFLGENGDPWSNNHVLTGPFAYSRGMYEVKVWGDDQGDGGLRREFADSPMPTATDVSTALEKVPYWSGEESWESYSENFLHNRVHTLIGGNMMDPASPNDPVFFLHHCYLDLLWERWKRQHPDQAPYLPLSGAPGHDLGSTLVFQASGTPAPWPRSFTVSQTIDTLALGYIYA